MGLDANVATVHLHDPIGHSQPQARAFAHRLGGEKRIENLFHVFFWDASTRIGDAQHDFFHRVAGLDSQRAARFHRSHGISHQIGQHLNDLVAIDFGDRIGQLVLDADLDMAGHTDRPQGTIDQIADVGRTTDDFVLSGEVQQARNDLLAAVRLFGDHRQIASQRAVVGAGVQQQVRIHQDHAQRIVHFMGDPGGQLSHAGQFLGLNQGILCLGQLPVRRLHFPHGSAELVDRVRQAHGVLGQPLADRHGMFPAGVVTTGAAV